MNTEINELTPVVEMTPRIDISRYQSAINATATTIFQTPSDKDFYLVAATLGVIKDATATSLTTRLIAQIDGVAQTLMVIPGITLTAQNQTITQRWPNGGILIDRGSNIQVTNSTNTANVSGHASIQGYTVERAQM
jgi:hypothetical protein